MNIVLTGGGTAGHIIPNLALVNSLNNYFSNIYYFGNSKGMEKQLTRPYNIKFKHTNSVKFSRTDLISNLKIPFLLPKYIIQAKELLMKNNINIVFSKGGFVALPTCIAAYLLKIPVVCHESDLTLGITNKITSLFAKCTLTSFDKTKLKKTFKYIGMPLRKEIFQADYKTIHLRHNIPLNMPILLIVGGSLGSQKINRAILAILDKLTSNFFVIHITGQNKSVFLKNYVALKYVQDIYNYFEAASVIVSRSGATSAFEIVSLNKKVLFIPLSKKASRGDQILNANYFKNINCANVLYEEELTASNLLNKIYETYNSNFAIFKYDKKIVDKISKLLYKIAINN